MIEITYPKILHATNGVLHEKQENDTTYLHAPNAVISAEFGWSRNDCPRCCARVAPWPRILVRPEFARCSELLKKSQPLLTMVLQGSRLKGELMSLSRTAYFANGFAVGGMMKCINCNQVPQLCKCREGSFIDNSWWEDDPEDRAPYTEAVEEFEKLRRRNAELEEQLKNLQEDFNGRLKPSYDYVDGIAVSVAEDEIDRLQQRNAELEAENVRLRKVLKIAFSHVCKFNDCRRMSGKVSDGYCYVHQQIYSVLEEPNAKDS